MVAIREIEKAESRLAKRSGMGRERTVICCDVVASRASREPPRGGCTDWYWAYRSLCDAQPARLSAIIN